LTSSSPLSPSLLSPSSQSRPLLSSPIPRASSSSIVPAAARSSSVVPATTVLRTSSGLSDSDSDAEGEARRYPARVGVDKIAVDARCRGRGVAMQLLEYVRSVGQPERQAETGS
jgi:GNAT superfamily N-acetyltransferase